MKKLSIFFGLTVILFFTACKDNSFAQEIHVLTPQEFHDAMADKKDVQLVDVRTPEEFAEGHLENALNINISETNFITEAEKLNLEKPIYIYCRSGKRSAKAALILKDVGFKEIYDMQGGYLHWESDGLPN
ncbi:MAG: rhodanese-like domain-containing protein [Aequorivita sp.]|nr:rhodanese-like domain-containing protein [Aequorivita sp.]HPE82159.1 rhodanese-like domain-containing protein [Aequorivita sp.]